MPMGVDEGTWDRAKAAARKQQAGGGVDDFWALVMHIYQQMQKGEEWLKGVLPGGEAEKRGVTAEDFDPEDVEEGVRVELEHTPDPGIAEEIALDHLAEHPGYYDALEETEARLAVTKAIEPATREVGVFASLPRVLAEQFPSLAPHDSSRPHVTLLYVGPVPRGDCEAVVGAVRGMAALPMLTAKLAGRVEYFDNRAEDGGLVAFVPVELNYDLTGWRRDLAVRLRGLVKVRDRGLDSFRPHVTLGYHPDGAWDGDHYVGPVPPVSSWRIEGLEVWCDDETHHVPLSGVPLVIKARGFPVGHVTTRADGSQWRKVSPMKWRQVHDPRGGGGGRQPGGKRWYQRHGMKKPLLWDGTWHDTASEDPKRYSTKGVERASEHMLRLRKMREGGDVPKELLTAAYMFARTSIQTPSKKHEEVWPAVSAWLSGGRKNEDDLFEIMEPLGIQSKRLEDYQKLGGIVDELQRVLIEHPTDGPRARDEIMGRAKLPGLGYAKVSFLLEMMGYSDVACIDARVAQHLTGTKGEAASQLQSRLSKNRSLYRSFEGALKRSASHKKSDPEEIRLGMAQWRMWDAEGGSDSDHQVFWDSVADVLGDDRFRKSLEAPGRGGLLGLAMATSYGMFGGGPAVYDGMPVVSESLGLSKSSDPLVDLMKAAPRLVLREDRDNRRG